MPDAMPEVAVVTGGSAGIGAEACRLFIARGVKAISLSRRCPGVDGVGHVEVDLSRADGVSSIEQTLREAVGDACRVSLVHNAADLADDTAFTVDRERLLQQLSVSLVSAFELNRVLKPVMGPGSSVIYIGSTLSEGATAGCASYTAIKHAVVGMMRATCQDAFGEGIHSVAVCPGFTLTEMLRERLAAGGTEPDALLAMQTRVAEPVDVAEVIVRAAESSIFNGAVLHASFGQKSA
ncbi:MAG: SDR family oxidoreductase [Planctomycetota bacterium]